MEGLSLTLALTSVPWATGSPRKRYCTPASLTAGNKHIKDSFLVLATRICWCVASGQEVNIVTHWFVDCSYGACAMLPSWITAIIILFFAASKQEVIWIEEDHGSLW